MIEEIAASVIIGMLAEQRIAIGAIKKRLGKAERKINEHESRSLPPIIVALLVSSLTFGACACAPRVEIPNALQTVSAPSAGAAASKAEPAPAKQSQGERLERASSMWGGIGIGIAALGLLASVALFFYIPALRSTWIKQGMVAAGLLAASITVWTLAPAMIYLFWSVSILSILSLCIGGAYALRQALHGDDTALIRK